MGIARALRRVKRQAKQGGLGALRSGLGEELRSGAIPAPLRGAARRIAAIIDPRSGRARQPGSTAVPIVERTPPETLRHAPPAQANKVGSDRGDAPSQPEAPRADDTVDPISVGATPVYDATPTEVAPVDATPANATPANVVADVTLVVSDAELVDVPQPEAVEAKPEPKKKGNDGNAKKKPAPPAQEKLAPAKEAATPAARSTPKAKSSGGKGGKSSKKK
jgi:hypothetical protein